MQRQNYCFRFQVNLVCNYVLIKLHNFVANLDVKQLIQLNNSELYNIRENLRKLSPICHKRPMACTSGMKYLLPLFAFLNKKKIYIIHMFVYGYQADPVLNPRPKPFLLTQ